MVDRAVVFLKEKKRLLIGTGDFIDTVNNIKH